MKEREKPYRLRAMEREDIELMYRIDNNTSDWGDTSVTTPTSRGALEMYVLTSDPDPFRSGQLRLIGCDTDGKAVAIIDLYEISGVHRHAKTGISVCPELRGRGIATSLLAETAEYCRDILNLRIISAEILTSNTASLRAFEKAGFRHCGSIPGWIQTGGKARDMAIMAMSLE